MNKLTLLLITFCLLFITANAQTFQWAKQIGGTGQNEGNSIIVDKYGNIYITGIFNGTVDFDPSVGIFNLTSAGYKDIFITKLDTLGNFVWAKQLGGTTDEISYSIVVDAFGNVYTIGEFNGTADFDPSGSTYNLTSAGSSDVFISKLDSLGDFVWAKRIGGSYTDDAHSIALDTKGNIYFTGGFAGTADFDPGTGVFNLTSVSSDIFVCKLDLLGNLLWVKQMGGPPTAGGRAMGIAINNSDNIYITGGFEDTVDFDPGVGVYNLTSVSSSYDIFTCKLDTVGNMIWAKQMGGPGFDFVESIATDTQGNVYTAGHFGGGMADFDPGTNTLNLTSHGGNDIFINTLDASGNFLWAKNIGGKGADLALSLTVDGLGNVYTTGYFEGMVDFNPGVDSLNLTSAGTTDIFVNKLNSSGNIVWATQMGGISYDMGHYIAVDTSGNVYNTGYFSGTADFDPGTGIFNLTSLGSNDIFVAKLSCNVAAVSIAITSGANPICAAQSVTLNATANNGGASRTYQWKVNGSNVGTNNSTYSSSTLANGDVVTCVLTYAACGGNETTYDSITMTVNPIFVDTFNIIICKGQSIIVGSNTYATNGTYTDTLTTISGCDSIIITNLTVNPIFTDTTNVTISNGDSIKVGTHFYNTTGTYVDTLTASNNCDSIITTKLTVLTGINTSALRNAGISIYPNPTSGRIWINSLVFRDMEIAVYNVLGEKIRHSSLNPQNEKLNYEIDLSNQPKGIYFVKVYVEEKYFSQKIVLE